MKPRFVHMLTLAVKLIVDRPAAFSFVECDRATMSNRPWQSRVAIMLGHNLVEVFTRLPLEHARARLIANNKRRFPIDRILLFTVNLDARMVVLGTKLMLL